MLVSVSLELRVNRYSTEWKRRCCAKRSGFLRRHEIFLY